MTESTRLLWILMEVFLNPTHWTKDLICVIINYQDESTMRCRKPWKVLSFFSESGPVYEWRTDEAHGPVKEFAVPSLFLWSVHPSFVLGANGQTLKINRWCENEWTDSVVYSFSKYLWSFTFTIHMFWSFNTFDIFYIFTVLAMKLRKSSSVT